MPKTPKSSPQEQLNIFLPYIADIPMRDQREVMERPFFSLAKSKRVKPIEYTSPDGKLWVHVSANSDYGMATIWDADILIYCASVLADMARRGINDIPRTLKIMPYDLLRAIGRPTTGRAYELLGQSLDRLVATTVKTNIRAENRREATFSWLDGWTQLVDEKTERSRGMTIEISNWFYEGVLMAGGVLSIDRAYFDIRGGRERWLYKVARKHAGGAGEQGFAISMPTLFLKSGAEGEYRRFKFEILKIISRNELPGYALEIETGASSPEPLVRMRKRDNRSQQFDQAHNPTEPTPVITHKTRAKLTRECPGWDLDVLHETFMDWIAASPERTPVNYQAAFIGFVQQHHARNSTK
ncbi:replication initiator protein A [Acetobacter sp. TBRC 12305]|uniref:Replication initiator protein A n=1 Tax=Acetobacter garciniae TaxID=2817435 RepID=A0A939HMD1_9PROT|nr:replication initiator protein A [Acetobacter garciniae]MBO1326192.1 replication initiator protein A [Acetobacter garciniae]MBX0346071.1 replication initiator protein A [Acetobacter garciniae]